MTRRAWPRTLLASPRFLLAVMMALVFAGAVAALTLLPTAFPAARGLPKTVLGAGLLLLLIALPMWRLVIGPMRRAALQDQMRSDTAMNAAANGIVITARNGTILWVNPAFTEMTGYALEEVVGRSPRILKSGEHGPQFYREMWDTILSGRVWRGVMVNRRKDGGHFTEEQTISPVLGEGGSIDSFIAIKQDITERRRTEEDLRRQALIFDNIHEAILVTDLQGTLVDWSPAAERIFGYSMSEVLGRRPAFLSPPDEPAGRDRELLDACLKEGRWSGEMRFRRKDGSVGISETTILVLRDESGSPIGTFGVSRDITERKRGEEALRHSEAQFRQAQKMEAVGRLAGGVAHDFNNLLNVITGYSEILLHRLAADDPLGDKVRQIHQAAMRAASLTRQLLAFSRKQVLEPKILDINALLAELEKMLRRLIGEDIELRTRPGEDLGRVKADPGQVEQIIMNLAVNARDAMPRGGGLTIETANVDLDEAYVQRHPGARAGSFVMLAVTDTGIGMDAEIQSHLFEPFFTTKDPGKGTGLGLATVYGIVKQSGGYVSVDSAPGRGAAFRIYLPRVGGPADALHPRVADASPRGTETILLVEDETAVRDVVCEALREFGYTVLATGDAGEGMEIGRRHEGPIHLLITDMVMPKMSGRALARRLTLERPEVRVLYISGYTDSALLEDGVLEPGVQFLQKPFMLSALARKVRQALDADRNARTQGASG